MDSSTNTVEKVATIIYGETDRALSSLKFNESKDDLLMLSRPDRLTGLITEVIERGVQKNNLALATDLMNPFI